jgi:hypothetical protein
MDVIVNGPGEFKGQLQILLSRNQLESGFEVHEHGLNGKLLFFDINLTGFDFGEVENFADDSL